MRLILDAHLSGRVIAATLRERGHDVLAIDEHPELQGLDDASVLALAAENQRVLITADVKDFMPLMRLWAGERRSHSGCMLISGVATNEFGEMLRRVSNAIERFPNQADWNDLAIFLPARG